MTINIYCLGDSISDVNNKLKSDSPLESGILYFVDHMHANKKEKTILGIITDNKLSCYSHIKGLCKKVSQNSSLLNPGLSLLRFITKKHCF